MKQRARLRRKPIAEKYQTLIAGTVAVLIIAGLVVGFGMAPPLSPEPPSRSVMGPR